MFFWDQLGLRIKRGFVKFETNPFSFILVLMSFRYRGISRHPGSEANRPADQQRHDHWGEITLKPYNTKNRIILRVSNIRHLLL